MKNSLNNIRIPFSKPVYYGKEISYVTDAVASTWISDGPYLERFESMLKEELGMKYVLTTSNGTTALMLAFMALGLMPGDEIIVPGYCFQAAANVALQMGIKPVFVDVDMITFNLFPANIVKAITDKTRAIVLVNNYGNLAEFNTLRAMTSLPIIEDCAESIFSKNKGQYCGTYADISTFSFHATKTLTTGEGGALVTRHEGIFGRAKLIRSHGLEERGTYNHLIPGNNFRMTNMQAALGVAQMENLKTIIEEKNRIYDRYFTHSLSLENTPPQIFQSGVEPVIWSYAIRAEKRDDLRKELLNRWGIETRPGFTSAHELRYFECEYLPFSERLSKTVLVLPAYTSLSNDDIDYIVGSIYEELYYGRN